MKILTFTSLFPNSAQPELGVFIYQRVQNLARLPGNLVKVIAPVPFAPSWLNSKRWKQFKRVPQEETIGNLQVTHPRYPILPKICMPLHGFLMFLGALRVGRRLHRQYGFDLVDAHYVYPDGLAGLLLGKLLGIPVVVSARGTDINLFPSFVLIRPMIRWTLIRAAGLIAVSAALADRMMKLGAAAGRIRVISNGVDIERFEPLDRIEARRSLGLPIAGPIIISVGSLVPAKRHDLLIASIARIVPQIPDLKAYIIGDGELRANLEAQIRKADMEDHVFLLGKKSNTDLCPWFSAANASCLASEREGWPNVVMESLACGTPVVATRVGGIPEIIVSPDLGNMVDGNPDSMAAGIVSSLDRRWNREVMVRYVRSRTWEAVARDLQEYLNSVLNASSRKTKEQLT